MLYHNKRVVNLDIHESAVLAIKEAAVFWLKARIPLREEHRCASKLKKLHENWRNLQKNSKRLSDNDRAKAAKFVEELDDLFDISHGNSLDMICIEEDKMFLLSQRQKGKPGRMLGIDQELSIREKKAKEKQKLDERRKRSQVEIASIGKIFSCIYDHYIF